MDESKSVKQLNVGQRVCLKFGPNKGIEGKIIEIQPGLTVGELRTSEKYKVRWNDPEYGESDWLSVKDLWV